MATADVLIENARTYAEAARSDANDVLKNATDRIDGIGYLIPNVPPLVLSGQLQAPVLPTAPVLADVTLDLPTEPGGAPALQDIPEIDTTGQPTLTAALPDYVLPVQPTRLPEFSQAAPAINTNLAFPEAPAQLLNPVIPEPTLTERVAPVAPDVILPQFNATKPGPAPVAPTNMDQRFGTAYRDIAPVMTSIMESQLDQMLAKYNPEYHTSLARIEAQLAKYLDGGTGLDPAVENAIYERGKDKQNAEYMRVHDTAWADAAARGFTLPNGALQTALNRARQGVADNLARASTDIAIAQAEMEQKNLQFAVTTSTSLRQAMLSAGLSYHQNLISINGQALEFAKTTLNLVLETYNTEVKAYSVALDAYRAEAAVYEAQLKGALAAIEVYKAQIDALQALTQVDLAKVNIYRARIEVLQSLAQVYRSQIDAVTSRASLEKLKLDLFGSQVQAYTAQVQAKNAEWQGYQAALSGVESGVRIYGQQVQAYSAEVQGWRTKIEAQGEAVRAKAAANQAKSSQYESAIRAYSTVVQARGEVARTRLEGERQKLIAFQVQTQAAVSYATMAATYYKTKADVQIEYFRTSLSGQLAQIDSMKSFQSITAGLSTKAAEIYKEMAAAALAGMNSLVTVDQA